MKKIGINEWFNDLNKKRKSIEKNNRETEAVNIRGVLETFHTDQLHFIFELLQNADDTGAKKVNFHFKNNLITFSHNGSEFTRSNVQKISSIGYSDKSEDQIGKFGMGFKSVYKITNQPLIYTSLEGHKFNFKIRNEIIPEKIDKKDKFIEKIKNKNKLTFFKLNINRAIPSDFFQKTKQFIEENQIKFLLFLNNLKEIQFDIRNVHYSFKKNETGKNTIKIKIIKNKKEKEFNFYVYRQKIDFLTKNKNAYIIFAFHIGKKGHFYRSKKETNLHIFLETHENTGLNFYLHAPFITNSSRTEINLENKINKKILVNCVQGFFDLIQKLKKSKLLNISFIEVLPNCDQLNDSNKFGKLHARIQECLARGVVWPCTDQSYQIARDVKLWDLSKENIFDNYDLQLLTNNKNARWLKEGKNTSKSRILKQHFEVHKITNNLFDLFCYDNDSFLCTKNLDWLFNFYELMNSLKIYDLPIIKSQNNKFKRGRDLRFSNLTSDKLGLLDYVHEDFVKKFNPKQRKFLRKFFESCGVREVNKHDQIKNLLDTFFQKKRYHGNGEIKKADNNYPKYLNILVDYYTKHDDAIELSRSYKIFIDEEKQFSNHFDLFIDDTNLTTYLSNLGKIIDKRKIFIPQSIKNRKGLISMATELGVIERIPMEIESYIFFNHKHPKYKEMIVEKFGEPLHYKLTGRREGYIDEEHIILFLDKLLNLQKSLPKEKAKKIAYAIANTLNGTSKSDRQASFRPRKNQRTKYEKASFMYILMETEWIPQKDGSFKKPKDSIKKTTDKKFLSLVTKNEQIVTWLSNDMDFASSESIQKNITRTEKDDEKKHGLPQGTIKMFKQNKVTEEELAEFNEHILNKRQKSHSKKEDQELETASSSHPSESKEDEPRTEERGSEYMEEEDHEKKTIVKVRVTSKEKKIMKDNKRKLKETHYLNHCQICCLATDKTFNEDFLVKSLGAINRKKLMDVHHIHSIGKNGPKTPLSNMLVLCNNHHYGFVNSYGHTMETLNLVHDLLKQKSEKTEAQLIRKDGTIESVSGYKITMTNNGYELFFTESHVKEFLE